MKRGCCVALLIPLGRCCQHAGVEHRDDACLAARWPHALRNSTDRSVGIRRSVHPNDDTRWCNAVFPATPCNPHGAAGYGAHCLRYAAEQEAAECRTDVGSNNDQI